jgi:hypothetical protein
VLLLAAAGCRSSMSSPPLPVSAEPRAPQALTSPVGNRVHVLVFHSRECQVANSYAPTLRRLATAWRGAPVALFHVFVDPGLGDEGAPDALSRHASAFDLPGQLILDPQQAVATRFGVTRTPEAVVWTAAGLRYRGRIDDRWRAPGRSAERATSHDLAVAVAAALLEPSGAAVLTTAVGCALPEPR